jgi:4-hydroxythreonine-4-phosphate dehydrogenase
MHCANHLNAQGQKPFMAFLGGPFILTLLTTHQPLASVSRTLTSESIVEHLTAVARYGQKITKKPHLKITVLGLNPHAGEGGILGSEEDQIILPAIQHANKLGLDVVGPVSADGFFAYFHKIPKERLPDVVVAMYHDQGLIPYKLLTKGVAVNVTFGLKVVRTSPAHGTATQLTEKNLACVKSTKMALKTAIKLAMLISKKKLLHD